MVIGYKIMKDKINEFIDEMERTIYSCEHLNKNIDTKKYIYCPTCGTKIKIGTEKYKAQNEKTKKIFETFELVQIDEDDENNGYWCYDGCIFLAKKKDIILFNHKRLMKGFISINIQEDIFDTKKELKQLFEMNNMPFDEKMWGIHHIYEVGGYY